MTQEARISSRIDKNLKIKGDAILAELGIKPSQAITMFYTQIVKQRGIPLELKIPNDETIAALTEDVTQAEKFTSIDAFMTDIQNDSDEQ